VLKAHTRYFEDCPKRIRAILNGETVADSRWVRYCTRPGTFPATTSRRRTSARQEDVPPISDYVAFYHDAMDKWLEEEEETIAHPHEPYHRWMFSKACGKPESGSTAR
jgi:hypothetical protein